LFQGRASSPLTHIGTGKTNCGMLFVRLHSAADGLGRSNPQKRLNLEKLVFRNIDALTDRLRTVPCDQAGMDPISEHTIKEPARRQQIQDRQ
jgi:hypothetical protein